MPQVDTLVHGSYFCAVAEAVALRGNMRLIQSPVFHALDVKACRGLLAQGTRDITHLRYIFSIIMVKCCICLFVAHRIPDMVVYRKYTAHICMWARVPFLNFMHWCFACLCEGVIPPGTGVTDSYELLCGCWKLNSGPLEE